MSPNPEREPRDPRLPGDERDERDEREPGDPRDKRDTREEGDPRDQMEWRMRPVTLLHALVIGAVAMTMSSGISIVGLSLFGVQQDEFESEQQRNNIALCEISRLNRVAAIADVRAQAEVLIEQAARGAEAEGDPARAKVLREVTGPPYIRAQAEAAEKRRAPVDCDSGTLGMEGP
jgi:hypothetical protein